MNHWMDFNQSLRSNHQINTYKQFVATTKQPYKTQKKNYNYNVINFTDIELKFDLVVAEMHP